MIYVGADHGGFELKEKIKAWLTEWGYQWEDLGNKVLDNEDDYPDYALAVAQAVGKAESGGAKFPAPWRDRPKGILACRSAAGIVIAANKVQDVRSSAAFDEKMAKHAREHNDTNVLALSGDWLNDSQAQNILKTWLDTEFSGEERHVRRLKKIEEFENVSSN